MKDINDSPLIHRCRLAAAILCLGTLVAGCESEPSGGFVVEGGNAESGRRLIEFYDCGSCHVIPGVDGADGVVGPPLDFWSKRTLIAGSLENNPENLVAWLSEPHAIEPGTAMPDVGATPAEARDIAAYLFTLE